MSIPQRRNRLGWSSLFTGPLLAALALLAVLVVSIYFLKKRVQAVPVVDTLKVSGEGMRLNGKDVTLEDLWKRYEVERSPHEIRVLIDSSLPWGKTWALRDTLKRLQSLRPNLIIKGLEEYHRP